MSFAVYFGCFAAHEGCKFIVHDFYHQLSGLDGGEYVLSDGLVLHCVGECLCHLVVYVGVEKCLAHILQGFCYIYLCDAAFALQYLK